MNRQKGLTLLEMILVIGLLAVAALLSFYEKTADFEQARAKSVGSQLFAYNNAVRAWISANPGAAAATKSGTSWLKPTSCGGSSAVAYLPCSFPDASLSAPLEFGQLSLSSVVLTTGVTPNQVTTVTTQTTPFLVGGKLRSDLSGLAALVAASSSGSTGSPLPMATDAKFSSAPATAIITMVAGSNAATDAWLRTDGSNTMNNNITFNSASAASRRQLLGVSRIQALAAEAFYIGAPAGALAGLSVIVDANQSLLGTLSIENKTGAVNALSIDKGSVVINDGNLDVKGGYVNASIFYDSNNNGYRIDPSDNSVFNTVKVGGTLDVVGRASVGEYIYFNASAVEGGSCAASGLVSRSLSGTLLSCQSGVWSPGESTEIQSGSVYTSVCGSFWLNAAEYLCNSMPYVDVTFSEPMASPPRIIVASSALFPFTPCTSGATDAIDHVVSSVTRYGFRLYGGASPSSSAAPYCGSSAVNGRSVSGFTWLAINKKH